MPGLRARGAASRQPASSAGRRIASGSVSGPGTTTLLHLVVQARPLVFTATLPGTPSSVPVVRRLTRSALPHCPRADDLMLAVTELAANAIAHSVSGQDGTFTVGIRTEPGWARVQITDDGPVDHPGPRNGWGLALVAGVTDRSGATIGPDGRRTAWAEIAWAS